MEGLKYVYPENVFISFEEKQEFEKMHNETMKDYIEEYNSKGWYIKVSVIKVPNSIQLIPTVVQDA